MGRIEKTVFISYRRDHGGVWARRDPDLENIREDLRFKELVGE